MFSRNGRRLLDIPGSVWFRRQILTANVPVSFEPITCKKGKPRKLDKEVHPMKQMIAKKLKAAADSPYFILFHYNGMKNSEWDDLRYELNKQNITVTIFPNSLSKKVLEGTRHENLQYLFRSSTAACYSQVSGVKALLDVIKGFPKLQLMGGKVENEILSWNQIIEYSKLPTLEVLQGQLLQLLRQPSEQLSSTLLQSQRQLTSNLQQYVSQNTEESQE